MFSLYNIYTVARYETKTLLRSWFFKVFAILAILFLTMFDVARLTNVGGSPWVFRAIASAIPYASLLLLNAGQAIVAIFLASEFLKQDSKNDSIEVIYVRPMTNGDYILGKTLGIIGVFLVLNLIILLEVSIFNLVNSDAIFDWQAYLIYPLLISLPTLVFILGLSFLFMVLFKNQAVTFIALLGYIALTMFYLGDQYYHLFDYISYYVPFMRSQITGFGDLNNLLIHRGIYFFIGLGLVFFTGYKIKRLPQSRSSSLMFISLSILFLATGGFLVKKYIDTVVAREELQAEVLDLNNRYFNSSSVSVYDYDLYFEHQLDQFSVEAQLQVENTQQKTIDTLLFHLNPGLSLEEVKVQNKPAEFIRKQQLIFIPLKSPMASGARNVVSMKYSGSIVENACYTDAKQDGYRNSFNLELYCVHKRFAFVEENFVCLTDESNWYPRPGVGYSSDNPANHKSCFSTYKLEVKTQAGLLPVSQGARDSLDNGNYRFIPEQPLTKISLNIGEYVQQSIQVDSIDYHIYTIEGHDYYQKHMELIGDTLDVVIRELKNDFEAKIGREYPFKRFNMVEVPVNFYSHSHLWTIAKDMSQPEILLYPEMGSMFENADFKRGLKRVERSGDRNNEILTDKEKQVRVFKRFVERDLTGPDEGWWDFDQNIGVNIYSIFPQYYSFINHVESHDWPLINTAIEAHLKERTSDPSRRERGFWEGISDEERVNLKLQDRSFQDYIREADDENVLNNAVKLKGEYLFHILKNYSSPDTLEMIMADLLDENVFNVLQIQQLQQALKDGLGIELEERMDDWFYAKTLPGYLMKDLKTYKLIDKERTLYQVRFKISNPEPVDGALMVYFNLGQNKEWGDEYDLEEALYIPAGSAREVGYTFLEEPRQMFINTLLSQNIPSKLEYDFNEFQLRRKVTVFDSIIEIAPFQSLISKGTYVVDNEDEGFESTSPDNLGYLRKYIKFKTKEGDPYGGIHYWRPPVKWGSVTHSEFYGKYIRSALYTKAGEGERKASWTAQLNDAGYYDIYFHIHKPQNWGRHSSKIRDKYKVKVLHEEGIEEVMIDVNNVENGWNYVGTYYISDADSARVEFDNQCGGRMVFADAVKWIKQ